MITIVDVMRAVSPSLRVAAASSKAETAAA